MLLSRIVFKVFTLLTTAVLFFSFASRGLWYSVLLIITCGMISLFGQKSGWKKIGLICFTFFIAATIRCLFLKIPSEWLLLSIISALSAWDLYDFIIRLNQAERIRNAIDLEQRHLKRLIITAGLSFCLGFIALNIKIGIWYGAILCLGLILLIGIYTLITLLNRYEKE